MRRPRFVLILAALAAVFPAICGCDKGAEPGAPSATTATATEAAPAGKLTYVEVMTGGASLAEPVPLVIAMHGLGDRPEAFIGLYSDFDRKARVVALCAIKPYHGGFSWFDVPGQVADPSSVEGIRVATDAVVQAVKDIVAERPPRGKPIVTGFSQGGVLSYAVALRAKGQIAAALPMGGFLHAPLLEGVDAAGVPPIFAYHGEADRVVPVELDRTTRDRLAGQGVAVTLSTYPGVGHAIPREMRVSYFAELGRWVDREAAVSPE